MTHSEETIERCPHDAENPYAQISRSLIRDKSISPECRWLLIYLLSNENGWIIKTNQIIAHLRGFVGRDRVRKIIKEAIEAGYMKRDVISKNNLIKYKYYVAETPKFKKSFRCTEIRAPETRGPENQSTLKKDPSSPKGDLRNTNLKRERAAPPTPVVYKYFKKVKIEEGKYAELVQKYGEDKIKDYIERLDLYGEIQSKRFEKYESHAAVIEKWILEDNPKVINNEIMNNEQDHRKLAKEVVHKFSDFVKKKKIRIEKTGIRFSYNDLEEIIDFSDIEFRDKLACHLTFIEPNDQRSQKPL